MLLVTCTNPTCRAQLFISEKRHMVCGKCNQPIAPEILKAGVSVAVPRRSLGSFMRRIFHRSALDDGASRRHTTRAATGSEFPLLQKKVDALIKRAWPTTSIGTVVLDPGSISASVKFEEFVSMLLRHVRHTTELSTPWRTPRIFVERTNQNIGGLFQVDEGWVRIVVGQQFFKDIAAARAILCHEVCHYILDMVDIRERPEEENERLTDVAMFVFGYGKIFRAGYRRAPSQNRNGHRVGYLSDAENDFVDRYVTSLIRARSD